MKTNLSDLTRISICVLCVAVEANGLRAQGISRNLPAPQAVTRKILPREADYSLSDLQQLALENNPTIPQAHALVERASGLYTQAGLKLNPKIGFRADEVGNEGEAGQQGVFVEQEFLRSGKVAWRQSVASDEINRAGWSLEVQKQSIRNNIRKEYIAILTARRKRGIAQNIVELLEKNLKTTKDLLKDRGTQLNVSQTIQELGKAKLIRAQANTEFNAAWRRMIAVIGNPDLTPLKLLGELDADIPKLVWQNILAKAMSNNPTIERANWVVEKSMSAVRLAEQVPKSNVTTLLGTKYDYSTNTQVVDFQISVPIPYRNRNVGNIAARNAEYISAKWEIKRLEQLLQRNLALEYLHYEQAYEQVSRYRVSILPEAKKAMELSRLLLNAGETTFVQFQTSQRDYIQAELTYTNALGAMWQSIVELEGQLLTDGLVKPQ